MDTSPVQHLIQKLARRDALNEEERGALEALPLTVRRCRARDNIVQQDTVLSESTLLLEGFTARVVSLQGGKRQYTSIQVTGDFIDLHSFLIKRMDHSIEALTDCTLARVQHRDLERITATFPHLTRMLWLDTVIDAAIHRTWIATLGRRSAVERAAHFLCEMYLRLEVVGEAKDLVFTLPLTQTELSDCLALSAVHTNRVVQALRQSGFVTWEGARVQILDWERLVRTAEFDPTYLSLELRER